MAEVVTSVPDVTRHWSRLGMNRNLAVMLAVVLIVGLGEELWARFVPQYLEHLSGGVWVVGA